MVLAVARLGEDPVSRGTLAQAIDQALDDLCKYFERFEARYLDLLQRDPWEVRQLLEQEA